VNPRQIDRQFRTECVRMCIHVKHVRAAGACAAAHAQGYGTKLPRRQRRRGATSASSGSRPGHLDRQTGSFKSVSFRLSVSSVPHDRRHRPGPIDRAVHVPRTTDLSGRRAVPHGHAWPETATRRSACPADTLPADVPMQLPATALV
jgi:hypothetical protein